MSKYEANFKMRKPEESRNYVVYRDVRIPMRDGVELSSNIFFPAKDGVVDFSKKYPVLLNRTAYMTTSGEYVTVPPYITQFATMLGYVVVINASRGTYLSEGGELRPLKNDGWGEHPDGVDTVNWLTEQPWSNGKVATCGGSYLGYTQYALWLTGEVPEGLETSVIFNSVVDAVDRGVSYKDEFVDLGTFPTWAFMMAIDQVIHKHLPEETLQKITEDNQELGDPLGNGKVFASLKYAELAKKYGLINIPVIRQVPFYREHLLNRDNPEYFDDPLKRKHDAKKPVMFMGAWYDLFSSNILYGFEKMVADAPTEELAKSHRLVMGPWSHTGLVPMFRQFPEADVDMNMLHMEWIQQQINGIPSKYFEENPVSLFVMGENRWRGEKTWPIQDAEIKKFYLHSSGPANTMMGKGSLSEVLPEKEKPDSYTADPANPITIVGGHSLAGGSVDQRPAEMRRDVLVYSSEVLQEDVEVTGYVRATLYAATSATDTDFIMKLVDVCPDGVCYNVLTGGRRGRYLKNGRSKPEALVPGEINEYQIELHATSYVFKKGHRIRVDVYSSDAANFDVNPNAFVDLNTATEADYVVATQTVYHDSEHPSMIELPVIPVSHERNWIDEWPFHSSVTGFDFLRLKSHYDDPGIEAPVIRDRTEIPTNTVQRAGENRNLQTNTSAIEF